MYPSCGNTRRLRGQCGGVEWVLELLPILNRWQLSEIWVLNAAAQKTSLEKFLRVRVSTALLMMLQVSPFLKKCAQAFGRFARTQETLTMVSR